MKMILSCLVLLFVKFGSAQINDTLTFYPYLFYVDHAVNRIQVINLETGEERDAGLSYVRYMRVKHGLIEVATSDMRGLLTTDGVRLLKTCHFIRYYPKDSLVGAHICGGSWMFLNFQGDTLNNARCIAGNYIPDIVSDYNPAYIVDSSRTILWGYLGRKAQWVIKPVYQEAGEFIDGKAKVVRKGTVQYINTLGEFVEAP